VLKIGPGPRLTTEVLAGVAPELTAIELDSALARATRDRVPTADMVQARICPGSRIVFHARRPR
jgi:16S rRNA A1518/A1519 N6-dimethyltransferase RsmA/KsgA/DIM1 with predicted DNA glycosylase/AP lyase activity